VLVVNPVLQCSCVLYRIRGFRGDALYKLIIDIDWPYRIWYYLLCIGPPWQIPHWKGQCCRK